MPASPNEIFSALADPTRRGTPTSTTGGVLLRMEQSGFRPRDEGNYKGANYSWQKFIAGLERVVAGLGAR
jgi:hypothetical protein